MSCQGVNRSSIPGQDSNTYTPQGSSGSKGKGGPNEDSTGDPGDIDGSGSGPAAQSQSTGTGGKNDEISRAIDNIRNSKFGKTEKGREVVAKLDEMSRSGDIAVKDLGGNIAGMAGDGTLRLDDGLFGATGRNTTLEGVMVHEATHELQADHGLPVGHDPGPYSPDGLQQAYLDDLI